jgi:hypothetical protein
MDYDERTALAQAMVESLLAQTAAADQPDDEELAAIAAVESEEAADLADADRVAIERAMLGLDDDDGGDGGGGDVHEASAGVASVVQQFKAQSGVVSDSEARRFVELGGGTLAGALHMFEASFLSPAPPVQDDDAMVLESPAAAPRVIDLTQDEDDNAGADDDDDALLAAAIAFSLDSDGVQPAAPAKSDRTNLMEEQNREFAAALEQDRLKAAATPAAQPPAPAAVVQPEVDVDRDSVEPVVDEPSAAAANVVTVRFTLPGGKRVARRFLPTTTVAQVRGVVRQVLLREAKLEIAKFSLAVPFSSTSFADASATLESLKLGGGVAVTVSSID